MINGSEPFKHKKLFKVGDMKRGYFKILRFLIDWRKRLHFWNGVLTLTAPKGDLDLIDFN